MNKNRALHFWLFVGPALILYAVFCLYPALDGVISAFTRWDGYTDSKKFIWFANFVQLWHDEVFWTGLKNNIYLVFIPGVIMLVLSFFFASVLKEERFKGRSLFQYAYLFPNIIAGTVVASLWSYIYNPKFGVVGKLFSGLYDILVGLGLAGLGNWLNLMELSKQAWLSPQFFMGALVPIMIWGGMGFYMVLFLAGMQNISPELYEAARIDGASEWDVFWHITWPSLLPITLSAVTFLVISGMKIFDIIWILTNGVVPEQEHVLATYVYQKAFTEANMGYGTAVAVVLLMITTVFVVTGQGIFKEKE